MDMWMDVDAALSEVPVNVMPLIDDTDFKTIEAAVAYNAAGMALKWNFVTTAGAYTQTAVTPTTAGTYDWASQGNGMYSIEIPASGGASINNDTEGFGWFSGVATGVLPWRGPVIGFRASGLNDLLIDSAYSAARGLAGTALPAAAADGAGGLPISDAGGLDLDTLNSNVSAILVDTGTTLDGRIPAALAADGSMKASLTSILGTALTETAGQIAAAFKQFFNVATPTGTMKAITAVGTVTGNVDGSVGSVTGAVGSVTGNVGGNVAGSVASVTGAVGSVTGNVGGNVTGSVGSLATQAKADVNAEMVDTLATDTYAESGQGAPAATATLAAKIGYLYKAWRNKHTQTATEYDLYDDAGTTVDQKATVSDDATTFTRGEIATGP